MGISMKLSWTYPVEFNIIIADVAHFTMRTMTNEGISPCLCKFVIIGSSSKPADVR